MGPGFAPAKPALRRGEQVQAGAMLDEPWRQAQAQDEPGIIANSHFTTGRVHHAVGRFEAAEEAFPAALEIDLTLSRSSVGLAEVHHSLGIVRANRGNQQGALESYRQAVELARELQPFHITDSLNAVAGQLLRMGRLDDSLSTYQEALDRGLVSYDTECQIWRNLCQAIVWLRTRFHAPSPGELASCHVARVMQWPFFVAPWSKGRPGPAAGRAGSAGSRNG